MDTDDLSEKAYRAVMMEAEDFDHVLTLQFGVLSSICEDENDFLKKSIELIRAMKKYDENEIEDLFDGESLDQDRFYESLDKILSNIERIKTPTGKELEIREKILKREKKLLKLTSSCCEKKLDDDYRQLCEKLIRKMGRKIDVPFQRGKLEIWAAAVVYALGKINFLFDKSFDPFMKAEAISEYFGTKNSTVSNKARLIQDMFDLQYFDSVFSTQKMMHGNPFLNMVVVDGFAVPLDSLPEDLQEFVRKERDEGRAPELQTKGLDRNVAVNEIARDAEREERIAMEAVVDAYGAEERAVSWYYYLDEKLVFPFKARCISGRTISPLIVSDEVEVVAMELEESEQEIFVKVRWSGRDFAVPLSQLYPVEADEQTEEGVEDWHYWVAMNYVF